MKILLYTFYNRWGLCSRVVWEIMDQEVTSTQLRTQSITEGDVSMCRNYSMNYEDSLKLDRYYVNGLNGTKGLLKKIEKENYDLIIGLGDYRKNAKKIRLETKFVNRYCKNKILEDCVDFYFADKGFLNKILPNPPLTKEGIELQISDTKSNGPCNRSAYLVSNLIERKNLKTKLLFLHIPRSLKLDYVKDFLFVILCRENLAKSTVSDSLCRE